MTEFFRTGFPRLFPDFLRRDDDEGRADAGGTGTEGADVSDGDVSLNPGTIVASANLPEYLLPPVEAYRDSNGQPMRDGLPAGARVDTDPVVLEGTMPLEIAARDGDGDALAQELAALGLQNYETHGYLISGDFPMANVQALFSRSDIAFVRGIDGTARTNVGIAENQADQALLTDTVRDTFNVDGSGITIGILSDSFDRSFVAANNYADDIITGDLPAGITRLDDSVFGIDEGRAMAQLIYDIAPGVDIIFHTAFGGFADFANGIVELASAGADIIVDDVGYATEAMFQDDIIAQAIQTVFDQGIPYFTSAGNAGRNSYESEGRFETATVNGVTRNFHDFDPGPGTDFTQGFTLAPGESINISLQWDQPLFGNNNGSPGATSNVDYRIFDSSGNLVDSDFQVEIGGDPIIFQTFTNTTGFTQSYDLAINTFSGPEPTRIKWVDRDGGLADAEFLNDAGASFGKAVDGSFGAAAAGYFSTPEFGVSPPVLESFSSAGGTPILFDVDGTPINEQRTRVDATGVDGVDTTFFGSPDFDGTGFPNFFGTSAAAPNLAAVAALMLEADPTATPQEIYDAMTSTAIDVTAREDGAGTTALPQGFDEDSGFGLVDADAAIRELLGLPSDDFAGDDSTTGVVAVDGTARGRLETSGDRDWFRIELDANTPYLLGLRGQSTNDGSLLDPFLRLYDSSGNSVRTDDDSGSGLNALIEFTPSTSDTFFLEAQSFNLQTGTYTVAVTEDGDIGGEFGFPSGGTGGLIAGLLEAPLFQFLFNLFDFFTTENLEQLSEAQLQELSGATSAAEALELWDGFGV